MRQAADLPDEVIGEFAKKLHASDCPVCGGPGPIDIHYAYRVMSLILITQFQTIPRISCQSCGTKAVLWNGLVTALVGWWGVPFGLIMTPIYLIRNLIALVAPPSPLEPSAAFKEHARQIAVLHIATTASQPAPENEEEWEDE